MSISGEMFFLIGLQFQMLAEEIVFSKRSIELLEIQL